MTFFLRPTQFVDTPVTQDDGAVARIAGGMQWFAAYEVVEPGRRRTVSLADLATLGERGASLHAAITAPRPALQRAPGTRPPM